MIASLYISLTDYSILQPPVFIGLRNFVDMFTRINCVCCSPWASRLSSRRLTVPLTLVAALAAALLLNQKLRGMRVFRTTLYIPTIVPIVASVFVWGWLLNPEQGLVNAFLKFIGLPGSPWLSEPQSALPTLIILSLWGIGPTMVIFLAGLQGVPESLYEAGKIDGANDVRLFRHITLPQLTPTIFFVLITGMISLVPIFYPRLHLDQRRPALHHLFLQLEPLRKSLPLAVHGAGVGHGLAALCHHPSPDADYLPLVGRLGLLRGQTMSALPHSMKRSRTSHAVHARRRKRNRLLHTSFVYITLALVAFVFILPLVWMLLTSVKSQQEAYYFPPTIIPREFYPDNYIKAWTYPGMDFTRWSFNTLYLSTLTLIGVVLTSSLVAFGFARIRFPGRDFWFIATLASIMLPPQVTLIPLYVFFFKIGWLNSFKPLWIPAWFGGGALNIFLLRQFFLNIPTELEDAAFMDGANRLQIWWRIFLPLSLPALLTVTIFTFQAVWNDFYGPLIYLTGRENYTLALGMNLFRSQFGSEITYMMAIAFLMTIPMIIIFFVAQRYFVGGIVLTGVNR